VASHIELDPQNGLLVFSQQVDARVDIAAIGAQSLRFFATGVGLTEDRVYGPDRRPEADAVRFVIAPKNEPPGIRAVVVRARAPADLALAEEADRRLGGTGLGLLARRCPTVWLIERESPADRLALLLAAVLASVLLGPIVDAAAGSIFGVKTARAKLEAAAPGR